MGRKKLAFINKVAGAANRVKKEASPTWLAMKTAEKIDKAAFLEELEVQWWDHVKHGADIEEELAKAKDRIEKSNYKSVFDKVGLTDDDYRSVLERIQARKVTYQRKAPKAGRNDPCPCGSGKKYKRCCGLD